MKFSRVTWATVALLAAVAGGLAMSPAGLGAAEKADKAVLTQDDCVKCHAGPPADVSAAGGKHKSDVTCIDCHAGHRPAVKNNIPLCSQCHDGKPHYQEKNCLSCHKNPHKPLNVVFAANVTDSCLACHADQIKQLREHKSRHSGLSCSKCHDVHRKKPDCVQCHKPHGKEMTQADCGKCHKAHQPTTLAYGPDVPNKDCGACHQKATSLLSATPTKHKTVACVKCHAARHKVVPACDQCHPQKHPASITKRFPKCGTCHSIAHDLNHWVEPAAPVKEKAAAPKEGARKKRK